MAVSRANIAAQLMEHLCTCPEHGYSQPGRFGTSGCCSVQTDVGNISVTKGDRDCSSAVCEAWELALVGTPYEGTITRQNWTGGMKQMFLDSGLFSWQPMSFNACRGDIYLDEDSHTAMCIRNDGGADILAEFSISESGDIDGYPGDQTGRESWIHNYYPGCWDGILHYNGKADTMEPTANVDIDTLAQSVLDGAFGNGEARKAALGDMYEDVQQRVNEILGSQSAFDVEAAAQAVIRGEYGNGEERKNALGSHYDAVQKRVNELLS